MRCDEVKTRLMEGAPNEGDVRAHLGSCASCREEFAFLETLRALPAEPPPALRDRVVAAFPARRPFRWTVAAWAASVAVALGGGFAWGHALVPPAKREVVTVERVVPAPHTEQQIAVAAIAGMVVYRDAVQAVWDQETMTCTKIRVRDAVLCNEMCPIIREIQLIAKERPDLVEVRK
jgi:hypothetical protein